MPATSPTLRQAVARAGHAASSGDPARIHDTRRDLAAERIASYIQKVVDQAPPLTAEQRTKLAVLLLASPEAA